MGIPPHRPSLQQMPYAIISAHDNPAQRTGTTIGGPPWESHYDGDMPFLAGVFWSGAVAERICRSDV